MAGILDTISRTATDAATRASAKADEMLEINRIRGKQADIKKEIAMAVNKIGQECFKRYKKGEVYDEELMKLCKHLERLQQDVKDYEEEIEEAKERHKVKQAEADEERL